MRFGWRGAALLCVIALVLTAATPVRAAPEEQPIRIQYDAHLGCPDALQFFWHVRARTQRVRLAEPNELATLISVSIVDDGGSSVGTLILPRVEGEPFKRRVEAATCEDVVVALSLVLALAYDPDAITALPQIPAPIIAPVTAPVPVVARETILLIPPPAAAAAGASLRFMSGIGPALRPVIAPFVEYASLANSVFRPRVNVTLLLSPPKDATTHSADGPRSASLAFFGGQLAGCPLSLRLGTRIELSPCVAFDLGEIFGSGGNGVTPARTGDIVWASVEAIGTARWNPVGPLFVGAVGGGGTTLSHGKFVVAEPTGPLVLHQIPAGFGEFGLDIGVHFP